MVTNVCAKFPYGPLHIKKALGIFRKVVTRRTTTVVAIWDHSRVQKSDGNSNQVVLQYTLVRHMCSVQKQ